MPDSPVSPARPSSVYGPVPSWRFGQSLGVDPIVEISTCSFNCIYCQLGRIRRVTQERRVYVPTWAVAEDLAGVDWAKVDVVTLSGSGEPTLAANLDEIVQAIRHAANKPIHLLTNATMLHLDPVRQVAATLDEVACKLDAPDDALLRQINRPAPGITLERIVEGIVALRAQARGRLALQIMFMPLNVAEAEAWLPLIERIRPDLIQLNTPRWPYPAHWYLESRGDHAPRPARPDLRRLRVIGREQAHAIETMLHQRTGIPVLSVYHDHPD